MSLGKTELTATLVLGLDTGGFQHFKQNNVSWLI